MAQRSRRWRRRGGERVKSELEKITKAMVKEAVKYASRGEDGGQTTCRNLGSAVAVTERTVYRWKAWLDGAEGGIPPSPKKLVALAKYCGWSSQQLFELKSKLLEDA